MDKTDQQNVMDGSALEINRKEKTVEAVARLTSMALSIVSLVTTRTLLPMNMALSLTQILELSSTLSSLHLLASIFRQLESYRPKLIIPLSCRYLVNANGVCAAYSLISTIFIIAITCTTSKLRVWSLFVFDQVVTYVVLAAASVSAETVYLTYKGNIDITWSSACDYYGNFCHKALFSVLFTFVVSILYVLLSFISSYRVFTRFEAPKM